MAADAYLDCSSVVVKAHMGFPLSWCTCRKRFLCFSSLSLSQIQLLQRFHHFHFKIYNLGILLLMQVVKYLIASFDIINATDHQGNTALHLAANRGQLSAAEALISASPSSISLENNLGETFLHKAVSGFQTAAFRRLDRQIELMKQLVCGNLFTMEDVINAKNNDGRTALHMAIIGNVHPDLVKLMMTAPSLNVNVHDVDGLTPLDYLRQRPHSASSDILIRQLISAGGIFSSQDYTARRAIASRIKMQGNGSSPGTSFRISDTEIFLHTGIENASDAIVEQRSAGMSSSSMELSPSDSTNENNSSVTNKKPGSVNTTGQRLKSVLWPRMKAKKPKMFKKSINEGSVESYKKCNSSDDTPTPLRLRFLKPSSLPNNKRTLSVRSNQSSPSAKKRFASGLLNGVVQAMPHISVPRRSRSSSFSKSSISSPNSLDKQKGVLVEDDVAGPSCSNQLFTDGTPNSIKQGSTSKSLRSQYFCCVTSGVSVKAPASTQQQGQSYKCPVVSVA